MRRMSISLASLVVMLVAYTNYASPVKGIVGAVNEEFGDGQENPTPMYIKDGLVNFWDGLLSPRDYSSSDAVLGYWYDVLRGEALSGYVIDAPYILVGIAPNSYAWGATDSKIINSDFSIHTRLELPKRNIWKAWSIIGIGREDGLQDGIVLSGANQTLQVQYRMRYSGTILNSIPLVGVSYGSTITYDLIFLYNTKTYIVYIDGIYAGESTILVENWNLDGKLVRIGMNFLGRDIGYNDNTKYYNLLFYNKALTADEIYHNYLIDKERFGL